MPSSSGSCCYDSAAWHCVWIDLAVVSRMLPLWFYNRILQCLWIVPLHFLAHPWGIWNWGITSFDLWRWMWCNSSSVQYTVHTHCLRDLNTNLWSTECINKDHSSPNKWDSDTLMFNVRAKLDCMELQAHWICLTWNLLFLAFC